MTNYSLAVGIPTSGRPSAIEANLDALSNSKRSIDNIVVFDNSPLMNEDVPYNKYDVDLIEKENPVGPGEARGIIADFVDEDLVLFTDDDKLPRPDAISKLVKHYRTTDSRIVSAVVKRNGEFDLRIGSIYNWGNRSGENILFDIQVDGSYYEDLDTQSVRLDSGSPCILMDTKIFRKVQFDNQYDFYFEWIDFFLQCYQSNITIDVVLNSEFSHAHFTYQGETIRDEQDSNLDRQRFCKKWGIQLERNLRVSTGNRPKSHLRRFAQIYARHGKEQAYKTMKDYITQKLSELIGRERHRNH